MKGVQFCSRVRKWRAVPGRTGRLASQQVRDEALRFANVLHMQAAELKYVISKRRCLDPLYDQSEGRLRHMREVTRQHT